MIFLRFMYKSQEIFVLGIILSLCMQTGLQATQENGEVTDNTNIIENTECTITSTQETVLQENAATQEEDMKGCGCNKPRPRPATKPKPAQTIAKLISTIVCEACESERSDALPESIRRSYQRAEQRMLTPDDVLYAMPTLMRYALEYMNTSDSRTQKAQRYVKALLSYMEKHIEVMRDHSTRQEIMDMLTQSVKTVEKYPPLAERMQCIMDGMTEVSKRA